MIIYLVKSTLLLGLLFGMYKLLLENEKMHHFNRFFLLFALLLGLTAPLISFEIYLDQSIAGINMQQMERVVKAEAISTSVESVIISGSAASTETEKAPITPAEPGWSISTPGILIGLYGLITLLLLIRFVGGLLKIRNKIKAGSHKKVGSATLVLLNEPTTPQSFFRFIFLNKEQFEFGNIEADILDHELTHVRQFHSVDILLIEFLKVIFWFNPLMYLYKHAIQLNHEFLADESVVHSGSSVSDYQEMLIRVSAGDSSLSTTSRINFALTKKRLRMMSSRISIWRAFPKMLFSVSLLSILALISCTETKEWPDSMTSEELFAMVPQKTYQVPKLNFDGNRSEELGIPLTSGAHFTSSGELFTGTQKVYYTENDSLYMELFYEGGINIGSIMYQDGDVIRQKHTLSNSNHTKEMYVNDVLVYQDIPPSKTEDGMGHFRSWHKNGQLSFELFYTGDKVRQGLMTEYDEEGNIIMQERYKDGELVETIKEKENL